MKQIITSLLFLTISISYGQSKANNKLGECPEIIINTERFALIDDSEVEILNTQLVDNYLHLKLKHFGSKDSKVTLIDAGHIKESFPPQRDLRIEITEGNQDSDYVILDYCFKFLSANENDQNETVIYNMKKERIRIKF